MVGTHIVADLFNISNEKFSRLTKDAYSLFDTFVQESLVANNMTLLNKCIHHFNDDGAFTSLYLLSESHLSFHSWPENNYIALDVFTCGKCDTNKLLMDIVYFLQPKIVETNKIYRGNSNHNQDKTILTFNQESNLYE